MQGLPEPNGDAPIQDDDQATSDELEDVGVEDPEADVLEQHTQADPADAEEGDPTQLPLEADEADSVDQQRSVPQRESDTS